MLYSFDYGSGNVQLDLDPAKVRAVLAPAEVAGVQDVCVAARRSIADPVGSRPLRDLLANARSALIVTVDNTRPSPSEMILPILDACDQAGVAATVIIAIGRHRQMTEQEITDHLGQDLLDRAPAVQHDPFDRDICRHLGRTSRGTEILVNKI